MIQKFIHFAQVERPPANEAAAEARQRLGDKFPRGATRRMTHLGMLAGAALDGLKLGEDDAIVYASSYAETRALEDFLSSFPSASPQLFQTSIHPSAVQQVLIGRQQPIRRFWPITGRSHLVEHALVCALLEPAPRVAIVGGEERGSWLLEQGTASDRAFAFALLLTTDRDGAIGRIAIEKDGRAGARAAPSELGTPQAAALHCPLLPNFADAIAERRPQSWRAAAGQIRIDWS